MVKYSILITITAPGQFFIFYIVKIIFKMKSHCFIGFMFWMFIIIKQNLSTRPNSALKVKIFYFSFIKYFCIFIDKNRYAFISDFSNHSSKEFLLIFFYCDLWSQNNVVSLALNPWHYKQVLKWAWKMVAEPFTRALFSFWSKKCCLGYKLIVIIKSALAYIYFT